MLMSHCAVRRKDSLYALVAGSVSAERVGQGEVGGVTRRVHGGCLWYNYVICASNMCCWFSNFLVAYITASCYQSSVVFAVDFRVSDNHWFRHTSPRFRSDARSVILLHC